MVFTVVTPPEERFRTKYVVLDSGCWEWQGANNGKGYGVFWDYDLGRNDGAHRASHRLFIGPIPDGYEVDHLCENPGCVNPEHLEAVTPDENKRRKAMRTTHCPSGHQWDAENTRVYRNHRRCRACDREQRRAETFCAVEDRTTCGKGHEWTEENTYRDKRGYRYCKACRVERNRSYRKVATEQFDLGLWVPDDSSSNDVDNVRASEDAGQTNPTDGSSQ